MAMTAVADTRLLLTMQFPPDEMTNHKIRAFVQKELGRGIILPSISLTEFLKVAGAKIGVQSAIRTINILKERGMRVKPIDEDLALEAGKLLVKSRNVPFADALIAAFVSNGIAEYVLTDDPHFIILGSKTKWYS
jgi:predicted nucleic acid-binding protein